MSQERNPTRFVAGPKYFPDISDLLTGLTPTQEDPQDEPQEKRRPRSEFLPYGYGVGLLEIKRYVKIADKFGVSLDYLFCRTDEPKMAMAGAAPVVPKLDTKPAWQTGEPHKRGWYAVRIDDGDGDAILDVGFYENFGKTWKFSPTGPTMDFVMGWYPLPEE